MYKYLVILKKSSIKQIYYNSSDNFNVDWSTGITWNLFDCYVTANFLSNLGRPKIAEVRCRSWIKLDAERVVSWYTKDGVTGF